MTLDGGHRYLASADLPLSDVHVGVGALSVTFVDPSTGEVTATYDREFGSALKTLGVVALQCGVAWVVALLINTIGGMFA